MAVNLESPPTVPPAPLGTERQPGSIADAVFRFVALLAGLAVLAVLALILYSTTDQAWAAFQHEGFDFITQNAWYPSKLEFGALSLIWGTLLISVIALVLAIPVSLGIALFITEIAPRRMRRPVVYVIDLLATIPSVVYGLWGCSSSLPPFSACTRTSPTRSPACPVIGTLLDGTPVSARSFMTAGIILAIMVVPIITSISREVFATTPIALKEASLALGATRWEMIRGSVIPHGRNGIVSASLIGLGRALGETIAVVLVIGSVQNEITLHLFNAGDSMASVIVDAVPRSPRFATLGADRAGCDPVPRHGRRRNHRPAGHGPQRSPTRGLGTMTATLPSLQPSRSRGVRKARSAAATVAIVGSFIVALIPLVLIIGYVITRGVSVLSSSFFNDDIAYSARAVSGGMKPAIIGTLLITGRGDGDGGAPRDPGRASGCTSTGPRDDLRR